jgi:hypothetical protein
MGIRWTPEIDAFLLSARKRGATIEQTASALSEKFDKKFTPGMVDGRLGKMRMDEMLHPTIPDCDMYFLAICVPWVSPETRRWLDSLERQKAFAIPAAEDIDPHLDGLAEVVA